MFLCNASKSKRIRYVVVSLYSPNTVPLGSRMTSSDIVAPDLASSALTLATLLIRSGASVHLTDVSPKRNHLDVLHSFLTFMDVLWFSIIMSKMCFTSLLFFCLKWLQKNHGNPLVDLALQQISASQVGADEEATFLHHVIWPLWATQTHVWLGKFRKRLLWPWNKFWNTVWI